LFLDFKTKHSWRFYSPAVAKPYNKSVSECANSALKEELWRSNLISEMFLCILWENNSIQCSKLGIIIATAQSVIELLRLKPEPSLVMNLSPVPNARDPMYMQEFICSKHRWWIHEFQPSIKANLPLMWFSVILLLDPPALLLARSVSRGILIKCTPHRSFCRAVHWITLLRLLVWAQHQQLSTRSVGVDFHALRLPLLLCFSVYTWLIRLFKRYWTSRKLSNVVRCSIQPWDRIYQLTYVIKSPVEESWLRFINPDSALSIYFVLCCFNHDSGLFQTPF